MTDMTTRDRDILIDFRTARTKSEKQKAYARYRRTDHWHKKRAEKIKYYPLCQMCPKRACEVHHRHYILFAENMHNDLVSLCRRCHRRHHRKT